MKFKQKVPNMPNIPAPPPKSDRPNPAGPFMNTSSAVYLEGTIAPEWWAEARKLIAYARGESPSPYVILKRARDIARLWNERDSDSDVYKQ